MPQPTLARAQSHPAAGPHRRRRPRVVLVAGHVAVTVLVAVVWLAAGPVSGTSTDHVAELVGLEAVWLLSSSVLVLSRSQRVERAAGGVEVELWWHRVAGALGLALGIVHPRLLVTTGGRPSALAGMLNLLSLLGILLVVWAAFLTPTARVARRRGPLGWLARRSHDRWLSVHRWLALFVVVSMVHGVLDSRTLLRSPVLLAVYAALCAGGLWALVERFVLARRRRAFVGASVVSAHRFADTVVLRMLPDRAVPHEPGQFVELDVPATRERPHPFTVVSAPDDPFVEVAVRASGEGTTRIVERVGAGERVRLRAVRGLPDRPATTGHELWVASGIGVTPFVVRVRARVGLDDAAPVDLVWTRRGFAEAPYLDELLDAAAELPWLTVHLRDTSAEDRLTAAELLDLAGGPADLTVTACGSPTAVRPLVDGLVAAGVPRHRVTTEAFGFR